MEKLKEYLKKKKSVCEKRAERLDKRIEQFKSAYEKNEQHHSDRLDLHSRQQHQDAICKQSELYAVVEFIEEIEQEFFNE